MGFLAFIVLDTLFLVAGFAALVLTALLAYTGVPNPINPDQLLPTLSFAMWQSLALRGVIATMASVETVLRLVWPCAIGTRTWRQRFRWFCFAANAAAILAVALVTMDQTEGHGAAVVVVLVTWLAYALLSILEHWRRHWPSLWFVLEVALFISFWPFFGCYVGCLPPGAALGVPNANATGSCSPPGNYPACEYALYSIVAVCGWSRIMDIPQEGEYEHLAGTHES